MAYIIGEELPWRYQTILNTLQDIPDAKFFLHYEDIFQDCINKFLIQPTKEGYELTDLGRKVLEDCAPSRRDPSPQWGDGLG